ncbi:cuticle protein 7-like [Macrobrachium rosenbergii]|uniref:cuticle protein 7-like n=1 Tax=Macrobrachium rosenbergii TaxID=79674 RepID=UPI0034D3CEFD
MAQDIFPPTGISSQDDIPPLGQDSLNPTTVIRVWLWRRRVFMVVASLALALALALPHPDSPGYGHPAPYKEPGMPFDFGYAVKDDYTGNDFAHNEKSDGIITSGSYRVLLPDGRTQVVTFSADHTNGYVAEVSYEGEAKYPPPKTGGYA